MLGITYEKFSHTSDHFDFMLDMCEGMIGRGDAYVDDTDGETMKQERGEKICSKNRNNGKLHSL